MGKKITVIGCGYVGLSMGVLLSQKNEVTIYDINKNKINCINNKKSPIQDSLISEYLENHDLNIHASDSKDDALRNNDIIILAIPTDFNEEHSSFDVTDIDKLINDILGINNKSLIVIKSTVPIGFTKHLNNKYKTRNIIFSPEFLEGNALYDNLHPSRIVVGNESPQSEVFLGLLKEASLNDKVKTFLISSEEAESIKLFSNTFLATRISFSMN